MKVNSCSSLLCILLACIWGYQKFVLRYIFLILGNSHLDDLYCLCEQVCKDPWLFFEAKKCREQTILRNTALEYERKNNNINSQADATITNFIDNCNKLNMFRAIISPILRSTRLCLQFLV